MLVARAEGAKQRTHHSAPAASPPELQVGFKGLLVGMEKGAAALEGTLAMPAEALELCPTAAYMLASSRGHLLRRRPDISQTVPTGFAMV